MKNEQELLMLYLMDELDPREAEELEQRMKNDKKLREEHRLLERSLQMMKDEVPADPGPQYWRTFYSRLQPRLKNGNVFKRVFEWLAPRHGLQFAGVLVTLAVIFIVTGLFIYQYIAPNGPRPSIINTTVKIKPVRGFLENVAYDHLERSRLLLQEMVNISSDEGDLQERLMETRMRGERLLSDNRTYRQAAIQQNDSKLESLLDDLETVLLDIANLEPDDADYELPSLKRRILKKNLLIKIEIINLNDELDTSGKTDEEVTL